MRCHRPLGVALGIERAGEHVGRRRGVAERHLHREVVVHGPPPRIEQDDAGGRVRGGDELSHHPGPLCTRRRLRGRQQLAPEPGAVGLGMHGDLQLAAARERVSDHARRRRRRPPWRRRRARRPPTPRPRRRRSPRRPRGPPPRAPAAARRRRRRRRRWARAARGPWAGSCSSRATVALSTCRTGGFARDGARSGPMSERSAAPGLRELRPHRGVPRRVGQQRALHEHGPRATA